MWQLFASSTPQVWLRVGRAADEHHQRGDNCVGEQSGVRNRRRVL